MKKRVLNRWRVLFTSQKNPVVWVALVAIVILLGLTKPLYEHFREQSLPVKLPLAVQTVQVKQAVMPHVVETVGVVSAKTELSLKAGASGKVQTLLVEAGSWVKEGTLLANIIAAPEVRAPFDGYLTDWAVKEGEYLVAGAQLIDLVNTEILSLTYRIPEHFASQLDLGQTVELSVKSLPNRFLTGVVRFISPVVDQKTHTLLLRAEVENPDQSLWPGMSARVRHILALNDQALVIPESCLILTMEGYAVLVVSKGEIERRSVTVGERQSGRVHVLTGLERGDAIVLTRTGLTEEGTHAIAEHWDGEW